MQEISISGLTLVSLLPILEHTKSKSLSRPQISSRFSVIYRWQAWVTDLTGWQVMQKPPVTKKGVPC